MAPRALPVSKLRARRRRRRVILALIGVVALVVLAGGTVGLAWLPGLRVHSVEVTGAVSVNKQAIEDSVRTDLAGTRAFIVPKNNTLLYPHDVIVKHLLEKFSAIESVTVTRSTLSSLTVAIAERTTAALWCGESLATPSACFLLDKVGAAYAPAADFSGEVYIKYYGPVSDAAVRQFLNPEQFRAMAALVEALRMNGKAGTPARVEVEGGEVHVVFESGFTLMYTLTDDGADVLQRFLLALQAEPFTTHAVADFSYLDLRFGDKLYYRLK